MYTTMLFKASQQADRNILSIIDSNKLCNKHSHECSMQLLDKLFKSGQSLRDQRVRGVCDVSPLGFET